MVYNLASNNDGDDIDVASKRYNIMILEKQCGRKSCSVIARAYLQYPAGPRPQVAFPRICKRGRNQAQPGSHNLDLKNMR